MIETRISEFTLSIPSFCFFIILFFTLYFINMSFYLKIMTLISWFLLFISYFPATIASLYLFIILTFSPSKWSYYYYSIDLPNQVFIIHLELGCPWPLYFHIMKRNMTRQHKGKATKSFVTGLMWRLTCVSGRMSVWSHVAPRMCPSSPHLFPTGNLSDHHTAISPPLTSTQDSPLLKPE